MQTQFRITPEGTSKPLGLDIAAFNPSLPTGMYMEIGDDAYYYITVETSVEEDESAQLPVQRELDRLFFFTGIKASAGMIRRTVTADFPQSYRILRNLPQGLSPQDWTEPKLALQLRLWSVAADIVDPPTKILILFQIVELAFPPDPPNITPNITKYPKYKSNAQAPDPRTEAKLLRHIVAHAGEAIQDQTKLYLEYLQLTNMMANRSDPRWSNVISQKVAHVQAVARDAIEFMLNKTK